MNTATFTAEFRSGLRATLTVSLRGMRCEWTPDLPRNLTVPDRAALVAAYRDWRDGCLREFAQANDLTIQQVHVGGLDCITFARREALQ